MRALIVTSLILGALAFTPVGRDIAEIGMSELAKTSRPAPARPKTPAEVAACKQAWIASGRPHGYYDYVPCY